MISSSRTYGPWERTRFDVPGGRNSMSPLPRSLSAPTWSRIVRESTFDETDRAIRDGRFALMIPVVVCTNNIAIFIKNKLMGISKTCGKDFKVTSVRV